ncbi:MAG: class I SAM-dependent methyltransferase [Planctomycetes bacterium]|nr:class I SAM-dependent methyltransferase [Planctomycetota bacterium]
MGATQLIGALCRESCGCPDRGPLPLRGDRDKAGADKITPMNEAGEYFNLHAESFAGNYGGRRDFHERMAVWRELIAKFARPGERAYDMGCGPGHLCRLLLDHGMQVRGFDVSERMLEIARREAGAGASFEERELPFSTHGLDKVPLIVCSSVLEYVERIDDCLDAFRDLLTKGGIVILSLPNAASLFRRAEKLRYALSGKPDYLMLQRHSFTPSALDERMRCHGLTRLDLRLTAGRGGILAPLEFLLPPVLRANLIVGAYGK